MTLRTTIQAAIGAEVSKTADFAAVKQSIPAHAAIKLANGTGTDEADVIFADQRTLNASGNEDLDLTGVLENALGEAANFATVKALLIRAASGNTNDVVVGPAAANGFTGPFGDDSDRIEIPPGGAFLAAAPNAGWDVTAGTGDLLNVANSGAGSPVTYDVIIVGTSA
ncbi:hypothetical protein [Filomicrobium sp.]|uniref:hypothetical protein n=1 Tax=Filomicrobium sp. TaxID=2024831 RepID=UPI0025857DCB|nr:hypothetical protein [Filomicrobium sp.]MCV0371078.1 hypothetical protein [Filomicrobium sp.]